MTYTIAERKYPNNQLSIVGWKNRARRSDTNVSVDKQSSSLYPECDYPSDAIATPSPPLVFSSKLRTQPIKCAAQSFRRTAFGKNARTRLIHAGATCDLMDSAPNHYLFITATLPGDDIWCKWGIAENAHHIVDRLKSWLSKRLTNRLEFYVWEHQKRAALHLHYCVYVPDEAIRKRIKEEFRWEWIRLLEAVSNEVGYSLFGRHSEKSLDEKLALVRTEVEEVKFSVAKYLSGYVGGKGDKHGKDKYYDWYPKRWWGISRPLCKLIDEQYDEVVQTYSSRREWEIAYENIDHKYTADCLTRKFYKHKVGEGKTTILYYLPEIHQKLCLQKQMLKHVPAVHPNISYLIQRVTVAIRSGTYTVKNSPKYKARCSQQLVAYLEDATWMASLTRHTFCQTHVRIVQLMYLELGSLLSYEVRYAGLLNQLKEAELVISRAYPYLGWNQFGWLNNPDDIPIALDKSHDPGANSTISPKG